MCFKFEVAWLAETAGPMIYKPKDQPIFESRRDKPMGWSVGYDDNWKRDIGYGVPAICDHPDCTAAIDRGLAYVCKDQEPHGGYGCGLYFCNTHLSVLFGCIRCENGLEPFAPKPDTQEWIDHKMTHPSWAEWRKENGHPEPETPWVCPDCGDAHCDGEDCDPEKWNTCDDTCGDECAHESI